ncbi:unnamed protein product [Pleuronectes platessa]|uniref:Uncharacterized protein n=1 Tax=Pleuronectes platessa TaxID=8262 RepID=A0A9N7W0B2_PLEPL|nr:unnamed protein product [Pleuronectes platessa]
MEEEEGGSSHLCPRCLTLNSSQSEDQSLITLWSNVSMYSNPRSARNMYTKSMNQPPSFDPEPFRPSQSRRSLLNVESPERLGASMRSIRSMDPPISFSSDSCQRTKSMDSPPSFSEEENLDSSQTFHGYGRVDSSESYGLSMMRNNRPMEPPIFSRVPLGPDSLDPGPEPVSQPEPDFTADISVKHLPLGYIEPPPSFKAEPIPRSSQSYSYKMSTERLDASMRRHRFMDPPTSFRDRTHVILDQNLTLNLSLTSQVTSLLITSSLLHISFITAPPPPPLHHCSTSSSSCSSPVRHRNTSPTS